MRCENFNLPAVFSIIANVHLESFDNPFSQPKPPAYFCVVKKMPAVRKELTENQQIKRRIKINFIY